MASFNLCMLLMICSLSAAQETTLPPATLQSNCPNLCTCNNVAQIVDCSSAGFNTVPTGISEYTNTLILDGNDFSSLTVGSFAQVPNLNRLSLKSCNIEEIEDGAFDGLRNLQTLEIQQNRITTFNNVLNSLLKLKVLKVSQNKLTILDKSMFENLRELEIFEAHNNDISLIEPQTFQDSPQLTHLYLPNCNLENLNENTFKNLINLIHLDISGNQNRNLGANIFKEMLQLRYLYLSNMEIESLNTDTFAQLTNLQVLSLNNNYLRTVSREMFVDLTNLNYLLLEDNQWNCTCSLHDFRTWERLNAISADYPWRCHDPEFLRNSIALNVDEQQFGCEPWIYKLQFENFVGSSVDLGKSVILICEAVGDPMPTYEWTGPDTMPITTTNNEQHIYIVSNRLIINSVVFKDEGIYKCTAVNTKGTHTQEFSLAVSGTITEPPIQQCPLAIINVETDTVTDTTVTLRWTRSFGENAIGYSVTRNVFGDLNSIETAFLSNIETEQVTIDNLFSGTAYLICVSVYLTGGCPSITTNDQCKQIRTTGLDENDQELDSIEQKHTNELIGAAIATFLGTLLVLASIFIIIWRYKMPREFTKYDFKITDDTTQFANMGDMPETSTGFHDYGENDKNVTLVASFNNAGYDGNVEAPNEQPGRLVTGENVAGGNDEIIHKNGIAKASSNKGKKTNGISVKLGT